MATTLDELVFKFEADLSGLRADMTQVTRQVEGLAKTTEKTGARMQAALGGLGRLFKFDMAVRFGQQLIQLEDQMEQLASQIRDTADRADIGVESLQRLRHAADQNGTSAEAMDSALIRLNKAMGLARSGTEGMREIFAALGLDDLIEKGANTETMFLGLTDAVSKMKDESQAAAIIARIMGREADRLIELMKNGAPEVRKLGDALSRVISEDTVNKLDTARDKSEEFKKVLRSFASDAAAFALSFGEGVVRKLIEMFEWLEKNLGLMTGLAEAYRQIIAMANFGSGPLAQSFGAEKQDPARRRADMLAGFQGFMSKPGPAPLPTASPNQASINKLFAPGGGGGDASAAAQAAERYRDVVADLTFEIEQLARGEKEAAFEQSLRSALSSAGVSIETERGRAIAELVAQLHSAQEAQSELAASWEVEAANATRAIREMHEEMRNAAAEWEQIGATIEDRLADTFVEMAADMENAREILASFIADIGKLIAKMLILKAIEAGVNAVFGGGGTVGGKALGGLANAGNPYIVGEQGPELFIPNVDGNIVPKGRIGGAPVVINSTVNAGAGVSRAEFQMALEARDRALARSLPKMMIEKQRRNALQGAF